MREIEIARLRLWIIDLRKLRIHHESMRADIVRILARGARNYAAYGDQTQTCLQDLQGEHWREFFAAVGVAIREVLRVAPAGVDPGALHLRAWASVTNRLEGEAGTRFDLRAAHNHSPALVSGVYYLSLPEGLQSGEGGTFFLNPLMHPLATSSPGLAVDPEEGRLVLFPGMLTHAGLPGGVGGERMVIGLDAWLVPGGAAA